MRVLGFLLALTVGLVLWGLTIAVSGGAGPLGEARGNEVMVFFIPIVVFAIPVAIIAFTRDYVLSGTWMLAAAPAFGFLNFAFAAAATSGQPGSWDRPLNMSTLLILVAGWGCLLGLILATIRRANSSGG